MVKPKIEKASSDRSTCKGCGRQIAKGSLRLRVGRDEFDTQPLYYCSNCANELSHNIQKKMKEPKQMRYV